MRRTVSTIALQILLFVSIAHASEVMPVSSTSHFMDTIGVNTHLGGDRGNPYKYPDTVLTEKALKYAGIRKLRNGISQGLVDPRWAYQAAPMNRVASDGYKFDIPVYPFDELRKQSLRAFAKAYPGAIISIEGPNEINKWPIEVTKSYQAALFNFVHTEASLSGVPVVNWSLAYASLKVYQVYGDVSATADEGNCHSYAGPSAPGKSWIPLLQACASVTPGRPMVITEAGWTTLRSFGMSEVGQAKSTLNMVMNAAKTKVREVYIYELLDRAIPHRTSPKEDSFGLFHADGSPKAAATALHNLHTILSIQSKSNVALTPVDYSVDGGKVGVEGVLLQKNTKHYDLVLWAEPRYWDAVNHVDIPVAGQSVSVNLPQASSASIYDPLLSERSIASAKSPKAFEVLISDHPVIVDFITK